VGHITSSQHVSVCRILILTELNSHDAFWTRIEIKSSTRAQL
jgi:hypothetical protein